MKLLIVITTVPQSYNWISGDKYLHFNRNQHWELLCSVRTTSNVLGGWCGPTRYGESSCMSVPLILENLLQTSPGLQWSKAVEDFLPPDSLRLFTAYPHCLPAAVWVSLAATGFSQPAGLNTNLPWAARKGKKTFTVLVPVCNRYSPIFLYTAEWQQLEFMKHAYALQVPCFYIQERGKMSLLCSVCQAASSFLPKCAPWFAKSPFLNYIPKGELDLGNLFSPSNNMPHLCGIRDFLVEKNDQRHLCNSHLSSCAQEFQVPDYCTCMGWAILCAGVDFIWMAMAVGNMAETGHKVSKKNINIVFSLPISMNP